jgi:hypothetical protein
VLCHPRTLHQITCGWVRCCPPANFVWHAHFWDEFRSPHRPIHTRLAASIWARRHRIHARRAAAREADVIRQILACALFAAAWIVPASAQTMSYADAISQLATACNNDIARYCKGVPLGPRLKACFDVNGARMSPRCQQSRSTAQYRRRLQRRHRPIVRHIACRCASGRMPAQRLTRRVELAMRSDFR